MPKAQSASKREPKPRTYSAAAKNPTITFRIRGGLYDRMKASAETRGFSLSEEIEHRLNRSLDTSNDHFTEMALQLIADNWRAVQSLSRRKMTEDKFTLQACCEAAYRATELLASVNGMDLRVGALDSLGPDGIDIEAGKQLGQAIVYHRELLHMKDPPEWAMSVYEANVIEALTKRISALQARASEQSEAPALRHATPDELAGMAPTRGQLPPEISDRASFDEAMGDPRPDDGDVLRDPPPAPAPPRRRKAKTSA